MTETTEITVLETRAQDLMERLSSEQLLPGESAADKAQLRAALLHELAPSTPLERRLADDLVEYEWEILRHRGLRDAACRGEFREIATNVLLNGKPNFSARAEDLTEEDRTLLYDLVCEDPKAQQKAEDEFFKRTSWEPQHLLAMAVGVARRAQAHEDRIVDLERRRRALLKDYKELKSTPRLDIEDAEIIE
jgi:hypothetical protein